MTGEGFAALAAVPAAARHARAAPPPVIDLHGHAMEERHGRGAMCPDASRFRPSGPIGTVQDADDLSPAERRDILYNDAVRFLRLPARADAGNAGGK